MFQKSSVRVQSIRILGLLDYTELEKEEETTKTPKQQALTQ
jgi:hypothetical protein